MQACGATFLPEGISDHYTWTTTDWKAFQFPGCTLFKVVKKLNRLKKSLKQLNGQHFRNILTEADEDRDRLKQVQKTLQSSPTDLILQQQESELHKKFRRSSYLAEDMLGERKELQDKGISQRPKEWSLLLKGM
ncbi:hypothetical protein KY284_020047 [Solanum tuberosum]|nr:hypothetical protein KY284_020047 [Solanum tuberosum]